jgi:hypothetical protein
VMSRVLEPHPASGFSVSLHYDYRQVELTS